MAAAARGLKQPFISRRAKSAPHSLISVKSSEEFANHSAARLQARQSDPRISCSIDGTVLLAFVASIGNLLQGWDNASIAGAMFYIKEEFNLHNMPMIEGSIMAMALFGATIITTLSGAMADIFGRRLMLLVSAVLSFVNSILVIFWSHSVYMLLFTRLIEGFSIGLAVTLVPLYISEIAPSDIRGKLNTFPQLSGSGGMFLSYCLVFWMSLMPNVDWRVMLGIQSIPSLIYLLLIIFYLPESPSWLVRQGRKDEAKKVLQRLRRREDVSGEMANLLEGMGVSDAPSMEEYLISPNDEIVDDKLALSEEMIKLYTIPEDLTCVAYPVKGQSRDEDTFGPSPSHGGSYFDPIVALIDSFHGSFSEVDNLFNEMSNEAEKQDRHVWDEESHKEPTEHELEHNRDDDDDDDTEDSVYNPLISGSKTNDFVASHRSGYIGGGWQLAWKKSIGLERVYLHGEGVPSSQDDIKLDSKLDISIVGKFIQATALVNKSVFTEDRSGNHHIDLYSQEKDIKGIKWTKLLEPGVKRALIVGVGIQILQQFAGINGIMYYTPQILEQAGAGVLFSKFGLNSSSLSILMSALTTLLMIPFIGIAMWLMDRSGRRRLLLVTIPILLLTLIVLVIVNIVNLSTELHAILSTISVGTYFCIFVMGFGPVPNIFCSEIFPTRVRAISSAICGLTFWICDVIVTYTLPVMMKSIGLAGVFGTYAIVCALAFLFVYLMMPETKGMPLEVMAELYAIGAKGHPKVDSKEDRDGV